MGKKGRIIIPKAPIMEQPKESQRKGKKIRRNWTRNPAEQIVPNKKKNSEEQHFSNKGNLRKQIEQELDENETE
jgi:hypothetical protein